MASLKNQNEIKDFHFYHGAVLTRILRAGQPISLTLIETEKGAWSSYEIDSNHHQYRLVVLTGSNRRRVKKGGEGYSWTCQLSESQMQQVKTSPKLVCIACVLPRKEIKESGQFICFLNPDEVQKVVDTSKEVDSITIRKPDQNYSKFQVYKNKVVALTVSLNAIDTYQ